MPQTQAPAASQALHRTSYDDGRRDRNLLLEALPSDDRARVMQAVERVALPLGMTVYEADVPIAHAYFPVSGVVSMVTTMREGAVEVGTVGREGLAGLPIVLHADSMPTRAFVQVEGAALRISAAGLRALLRESAPLEQLLHRYALALFDHAAQNAACNRLHVLEARCARWLLTTHDRLQSDVLPIKHRFLAEMLGVHRPAVTVAAGALQHAGVIRYSRGKVTIVDRTGLERASCACYEKSRVGFERLRAL